MQVVIDIRDDWFKFAKFHDIENGSMVAQGILDAVANGTPLEKLLDDIMLDIEMNMPHDFCCDEWGNTTSEWAEIMKIISKYAKEND